MEKFKLLDKKLILLFFIFIALQLPLISKNKPLLFGRYTKLSLGIGEEQLCNVIGTPQPKGLVYNIELEHFLDSAQNWSLNINYFYIKIKYPDDGIIVLEHLPTTTLKYYLLRIEDIFSVNIHAGSYLTAILFTWDIGGGISYNLYDETLYLESSIHYISKFFLFLPAVRLPLIYKASFGFKF